QTESFILPTLHAADHLLNRPAEPCQIQRRPVCAVAMRTIAVNDKQNVLRIRGKISFADPAVGKIARSRQMAGGISFRATHVEKYETRVVALKSGMHIPAIGFQ